MSANAIGLLIAGIAVAIACAALVWGVMWMMSL